jgi:hypothetical protein
MMKAYLLLFIATLIIVILMIILGIVYRKKGSPSKV